MSEVLITTSRGRMPCYLAEPPGSEPHPGAIVLHDVGGMSKDHRSQADWLAEAGFIALAVDLYYRGGMLRCLRAIARDLMERKGPAFDDVEACRFWLGSQPGCTGKVGVIGFCMGGGFALLLVSGRGSRQRALITEASSRPMSIPSSSRRALLLGAMAAKAVGNRVSPTNWNARSLVHSYLTM